MRDEAGHQSQPGLLSREVGVLAPVHLICLQGWGVWNFGSVFFYFFYFFTAAKWMVTCHKLYDSVWISVWTGGGKVEDLYSFRSNC